MGSIFASARSVARRVGARMEGVRLEVVRDMNARRRRCSIENFDPMGVLTETRSRLLQRRL